MRTGRWLAASARGRQRGQALVFIAVTAVIVLLVTLATFNVGQLSFHRMKLQNTADATAYTAAVSHARALNFTAYMNRGVIANQVQVAQVVSLTGWVRTVDDTYNGPWSSVATVFANLSPMSAMWTVPSNVIARIANPARSLVDNAAPVVVTALDVLIDALSAASGAYHVGFLANLIDSIPEVIKANEPGPNGTAAAQLTTLGIAAMVYSGVQATQFVTLSPSKLPLLGVDPSARKDGDDRMAKVTQASNDYFYKGRVSAISGEHPFLVPVWPIPFLIDPSRLVNPGFGPLFMIRFHSGGGSLKKSDSASHTQAWGSLDATGLMAIMSLTLNILGIPIPIPIPLFLPAGGGAAVASGHSDWNGSQALQPNNSVEHRNPLNSAQEPWAMVQHGAAHFNPMTAISAWIKTAEGPGSNLDMMSRAGLRPYIEVSANVGTNESKQANLNASAHNRNDVAPPWLLEIAREDDNLLTSASGGYRIGGSSSGQLALPLAAIDGRMRALASAEAYFARPADFALFQRPDGKTEWGSTYSPYWQARLRPNSVLEQGLTMGINTLESVL